MNLKQLFMTVMNAPRDGRGGGADALLDLQPQAGLCL